MRLTSKRGYSINTSQLVLMFLGLFMFHFVEADTITCQQKTITVQNGKITQIRHEDGTVHSGSSVQDNWSFDGKSIKHRLMDERIQCGTKPNSRNEIIEKLSSRFVENPIIYGMSRQEAQWMTRYTENLMRTDENCHLLVDAAKSIDRNEAFYIDCNDRSGNSKRYWVSRADLKAGNMKKSAAPISKRAAIDICNAELRSRTTNPSTYRPALLTGTTSRIIKATGRNIVEIEFTAKSGLGMESNFQGKCILESGHFIEAEIKAR